MVLFGYSEIDDKASNLHKNIGSQKSDSIPLFNGKDLSNWQIIANDSSFTGKTEDIFTVENGVIHVYSHQEPSTKQVFAALYTKDTYSNYKLTLEYKWGQKKFKPRDDYVRDAGVLFHVYRKDVFWPFGVECQIQEGDTGDVWVIGTQVTSKVHPVNGNYNPEGKLTTKGSLDQLYNRFPRSFSWEVPGWNKIEIEVVGDHAKYWINGHFVNEALDMKYWSDEKESWEPLTSGNILLQAEGSEVFYRNIYLTQL
jgi:hypothetical protein